MVISVDDDLLDSGLLQDPFPYYQELRETRPVHWNERWRGWIVSKYEDVYAGLHDKRMLADTITPYFDQRMSPQDRERFSLTYEVLNSWPVFVDPPKHTHLRKIFSKSFTPKTVQTEELRTSLVYEVRIEVDDPADTLRLGMPATVRIEIQ